MLGLMRQHLRQLMACWLLVLAASLLAVMLMANSYWTGLNTPQPDLLIVSNALSPQQFLPFSYLERVDKLAGVEASSELSSALAWLPVLSHTSAILLVDKDGFPGVVPQLGVEPNVLAAWRKRRDGVLVSAALWRRLSMDADSNLQVLVLNGGQKQALSLSLQGSFQRTPALDCEYCILVGRELIEQALPAYRGIVSAILVRSAGGATASAELAKRIDASFAHDTYATRSGPFSAAQGAHLHSVMNLRTLAIAVVACVLLTVLAIPALIFYLNGVVHRPGFALLLCLGFTRAHLYRRILLSVSLMVGSACASAFALAYLLDGSTLTTDVTWLRFESPALGLAGAVGVALLTAACSYCAIYMALHNTAPAALNEETM
ncbi:hypothetical protein RugamoR64_55700 [Duganella rhizosphaerae]|uniref:hypothetical protein n=1 Tax=Duganella rhizosphaerae TaxID=2885763 RepID=UPI0030EA7ECC